MIGKALERVLCLPLAEVHALTVGQLVCAMPNVQIQPGASFYLYPIVEENSSVENKYRPIFLERSRTESFTDQSQNQKIEVWAKCEFSNILYDKSRLENLSDLTIWRRNFLIETLQQRGHLFISCLQIYKLAEKESVLVPNINLAEKLGKFTGISTFFPQNFLPQPEIKVNQICPVISDSNFRKRSQQLEQLSPLEYPELEKLQRQISQIIFVEPYAKAFNEDLRSLLGWASDELDDQVDLEITWIKTIAETGNSSDGILFEKLVRKSLIKLGFSNSFNTSKASLNPDATGGAGGIDVYCDSPFSLVGECKATQSTTVSNSVSAQLINLGITHLGQAKFNESVKVIFAAGTLSVHAENAACQNHMNVIRPETLQRLLELRAKHPGSINLRELEACLRNGVFGYASDQKVNDFIDHSQRQVDLRTQLVQRVKMCQEALQAGTVSADNIFAVYAASNPVYPLNKQEIFEILIELSSPITGYLGRVKDTDHFYFSRNL